MRFHGLTTSGSSMRASRSSCNPECVNVREQRKEPENGDHFELHFLVTEALGQGVKREEENAKPHDGTDHNNGGDDVKRVTFMRSADEPRHVM